MSRILLIISNPHQAAYRLRWEQLLPALKAHGIDIDVQIRPKGILGRRRLARSANGYDSVIIQRKMLDPWEASLLRRHARRVLLDIDDATMYSAHGQSRFSAWRQQRRFRATAAILDLAVVGNDYLQAQFAAQGCKCAILPTTVDPQHYQAKQHHPSDSLRLVWIGSRSTLPYLQQYLPAIEQAHNQPLPLELITIADATVQSSRIPIRHIHWSLAGEAAALVEGDIGIAPTPDDPWAMGKCGFKIIQYMASSLPVIASPVGANAQIVRAGETGLLPATAPDWPTAIAQLATDVALRQQMGAAGRSAVLAHYSLSRAISFWSDQLR